MTNQMLFNFALYLIIFSYLVKSLMYFIGFVKNQYTGKQSETVYRAAVLPAILGMVILFYFIFFSQEFIVNKLKLLFSQG